MQDRLRLKLSPPNVALPSGSRDIYINASGDLIKEGPGGVKETVGVGTTESVLALLAANPDRLAMSGEIFATNSELHAANKVVQIGTLTIPASRAVEGQKYSFKGTMHLTQLGGEEELEHAAIIIEVDGLFIGCEIAGSSGSQALLLITDTANSIADYNGIFELSNSVASGVGKLHVKPFSLTSGFRTKFPFASGTPLHRSMAIENAGTENEINEGEASTLRIFFAVDSVSKPGYDSEWVWGNLSVNYDIVIEALDS